MNSYNTKNAMSNVTLVSRDRVKGPKHKQTDLMAQNMSEAI